MQDLILYGAGGLGKEVASLVDRINQNKPKYRLLGYVVGKEYFSEGEMCGDYPIIGDEDWLLEHKDDVLCACCVGYPVQRKNIMKRIRGQGVRFANLIHPDAEIQSRSTLGEGCIIQKDCGITVDVVIGTGVYLSGEVIIGHDTVVSDYVTCFTRATISGKCKIGEAVSIGSMSFLLEGVKVGDEAIVAPGSIVFSNVNAHTHVMGNPAKRIEL